ncbi:GAP family protein [Streptomyces anulatus]
MGPRPQRRRHRRDPRRFRRGRGGRHRPPWTLWLKLALGLLFLLLGAKQWKDRPREGHEASTPGWRKAIDTFTPAKAAGLAAALAVANPKNLVLAVGGAVSIASSTATAGGKTVAGVLMVLIASCAPSSLSPSTSAEARGRRRSWATGRRGWPATTPPS